MPRTPDEVRAAKREWMARQRATPEGRERQREIARKCYANGGLERQRDYNARLKPKRPFAWRAKVFRAHGLDVTEADLVEMWTGHCALTGREIDPLTAHLDHIVPLSRGGTHDLSNLRWTCPEVNYAKRDLLDEEFVLLCREVAHG